MAVKKLEDDRYQVDVVRPNGTRARRIFDKRREAVAFEAQIRKEKYEAKLVRTGLKRERYLMEQAISDFEQTKQSLRATSIKRLRPVFDQLRIFVKACGIETVDQFSPDHATWLFNAVVGEKADPRGNRTRLFTPKPRTVNTYIQAIRALFADEVAKGHIERNPFLHIKNMRKVSVKPEYYRRDELLRFFAQPMDQAYRNAFMGLLHTGMRYGEMAHLTWIDVDFQSGFIHVRARGDFQPKSHASTRAIPMNRTLRNLLTEMERSPISDHFVFCSPQGNLMRERLLIYFCKKFAVRAGITSRAFLHKFRHTFASHLVQQRVPLESIKQLLGHSSVTQTEIYAHNESDLLHEDVLALDDLFE